MNTRSGQIMVGVEEEFQIVDSTTGTLSPESEPLLKVLSDDRFAAELQASIVESNSRPTASLTELADDLAGLRRVLGDAGRRLDVSVVAAGTCPLGAPESLRISTSPRYETMLADYQGLAREQLICSTQIHVDVGDRDLAVGLLEPLAPWLSTLLAISASSPYWLGSDTGYASYRTLVWQRWPTAGAPGPLASAADYDRLVGDLIASGVIRDRGMIYFDVRPSAHLPTLELRVCDACPRVDDVVLLAGLFRALVLHESKTVRDGRPPPGIRREIVSAARWRAARSGLEGELLDPLGPYGVQPVPAARAVAQLLARLRTTLEALGDWELVSDLAAAAVARGSSARRQRAAHVQEGGPRAVVTHLSAETLLGFGATG
jgi:glutamate---cysteine ligase / carboxylate-amine ligase